MALISAAIFNSSEEDNNNEFGYYTTVFGTIPADSTHELMKTLQNIDNNYVVLSCSIAAFAIRFQLTFVLKPRVILTFISDYCVYTSIMSVFSRKIE